MKHSAIFIALVFGGISITTTGPAAAADLAVYRRAPVSKYVLPFPRSARAEAIWASDACWSDCGSYTAWAFSGCLKHDAQGRCLTLTDASDRACQRACRLRGGPYLPID